MSFRVGQKVVCVNSGKSERFVWGDTGEPKEGEIYTVLRVFIDDEGFEVLHLFEICRDAASRKEWGDDVGYAAYRFRPIVERKTDISIFTRMLKPSKVVEA